MIIFKRTYQRKKQFNFTKQRLIFSPCIAIASRLNLSLGLRLQLLSSYAPKAVQSPAVTWTLSKHARLRSGCPTFPGPPAAAPAPHAPPFFYGHLKALGMPKEPGSQGGYLGSRLV